MRRTLTRTLFALIAAAAACSNGSLTDAAPVDETSRAALFAGSCASPAPLHLAPAESRVPDAFIVVYQDGLTDPNARTSELAAKYDFTTRYRWEHALKGFAADLRPATVRALRCEAGVKYIEEDAVVSIEG